jgi:hypothetical protein
MMPDFDELKQALIERANLDEEQATRAAQVALDFLAERVPQLGDLLDKAGGAEGLAGRLGGLFSKKD